MLLGAGYLSAVSCGARDPHPAYPVRGTVTYRDKPAEGAHITFHPEDSTTAAAPRPTAAVAGDGTFRLTTRLAYDGAPAGRYAVTIIYRSPHKKIDDENAGPDVLQGRYSNPKTTPLHVEIKPGDNELEPFRLK